MSADLDLRRRRAAWRAAHRGTKELDLLVGGYADAHLAKMTEPDLQRFEALLAVTDPDLQRWLLDPVPEAPTEHAGLVSAMRTFHGLS